MPEEMLKKIQKNSKKLEKSQIIFQIADNKNLKNIPLLLEAMQQPIKNPIGVYVALEAGET